MDKLQVFAAPVGRLLLGGLFVMAGLSKIGGYAATQGMMEGAGVPGILLPVVILTEAGGGFAIILGWQTRIAAFALAGFCALSAILFHFDPANQMQMGMFMKNFGMAGGFLLLVAFGAGAYSLDNRGS